MHLFSERRRKAPSRQEARIRAGAMIALALSATPLLLWSGDIARPGRQATGASGANPGTGSSNIGVPAPSRPDAEARIQAARDAVAQARAMQDAANAIARQVTSAQKVGANLWRVPVAGSDNTVEVVGGLREGGLVPRIGGTWSGANAPTEKTTADGYEVTIKQTSQQAVLDWTTYNIAPNTSLTYDQSAGGDSMQEWIAFNRIGVTGSPSMILGKLNAGGQVYVINPNGILFGGTSQVNVHTLVASSLPINDRLVERGLLNNPDYQFLFTAYEQVSGTQGPTAAFTPKVTDVVKFPEVVNAEARKLTLRKGVASNDSLVVSTGTGEEASILSLDTDFSRVVDSDTGATDITLTDSGVAKVSGKTVEFNYQATPSSLGEVTVQAGARIFAPSQGNSGGRIALVGKNVTNEGHISTPSGQTILAAGLEVGFLPHNQNDPSLRGLDAYVGRVTDTTVSEKPVFGTVTNATFTTPDGNRGMGIVETRDLYRKQTQPDGSIVDAPIDMPGSILFVGRNIDQQGIVNSATTVSFNGRVDLLANYNVKRNDTLSSTNPAPYFYRYDMAVDGGDNTGVVTFGNRSVTQILPSSSSETISKTVEDGLTLRSQINVVGQGIHLSSDVPSTAASVSSAANAAKIIAPNAKVTFDAGAWHLANPSGGTYRNQFLYATGRIFLDRGSVIDVSGTRGAQAPITRNIFDVQLRGSELADAPIQRDGVLRGKTVKVDSRIHGPWDPKLNDGRGGYSWVGTPLADTSGWLGLVERTVGELTIAGGDISLNAGAGISTQALSALDVSGGWIDYAGGTVSTTKVVSDGTIFDISQVTKDRVYDGIFDATNISESQKWGVSETSINEALLLREESGYFEGGRGGKLSLFAPSMALDGRMTGAVQAGQFQTATAPVAGRQQLVTTPSSLKLRFGADSVSETATSLTHSPFTPNVTFGSGAALAAISKGDTFNDEELSTYLREERRDLVAIDPSLFSAGHFGFFSLDVSDDNFGVESEDREPDVRYGTVTITAADPVRFTAASALGRYTNTPAFSVTAANINLLGTLEAPGGIIELKAKNISDSRQAIDIPEPEEGRGLVAIGPKAKVSVSGRVEDRRIADRASNEPVATNAGSFQATGYTVTAAAGSRFEANGGAEVSGLNRVQWGDAGRISLSAANERQFDGATLTLSPTLRGFSDSKDTTGGFFAYSGSTKGGTLALQGSYIDIAPLAPAEELARTTRLSPDLFSKGGFSSFEITGLVDRSAPTRAAVNLAGIEKTNTSPSVSLTLAPSVTRYSFDTQKQGADGLKLWQVPSGLLFDPLRSPVSLSFTAKGLTEINDANFALGVPGRIDFGFNAGVVLATNPSSRFSLSGSEINFLGVVVAQGGRIELSASRSPDKNFATPTLYVAPTARLLANGALYQSTNALGYNSGTVLPGGTVSLRGNVVTAKGSVIDVSGANGKTFVLQSQVQPGAERPLTQLDSYVEQALSSDGGTISLSGITELFSDATLIGKSGGTGAVGGKLVVSSDTFLRENEVAVSSRPNLMIAAKGPVGPTDLATRGSPIGSRLTILVPKDTGGLPILEEIVLSPISRSDGEPSFGGVIAVDSFNTGGFDQYEFKGKIEYAGAVELSAGSSIRIADGGVLNANAKVPSSLAVSAPYVFVGVPFQKPGQSFLVENTYSPTYGTGTVGVKASKWLDVGTITFRGTKSVSLETGPGGDLRGSGSVAVAGKLSLTAGQVYAPTVSVLTLAAYNPLDADGLPIKDSKDKPLVGSVSIGSTGTPGQVPLSAGARVEVFADTIQQNGVVRAPLGQIALGQTEALKKDAITGAAYPTASSIVLGDSSVTSVSTLDLTTGKPSTLPIPYGVSPEGATWIDPTGLDITVTDSSGRTEKRVTISGAAVNAQSGSKVDVDGGGDLFAYRWVLGVGGKQDLLSANTTSYAIVPTWSAPLAPFAPFNPDSTGTGIKLGGDLGYVSNNLSEGDSIWIDLDPSDKVGAQSYTLLPARYALLPGAYLVTPKSGLPVSGVTQTDGAIYTSGYRYNALNASRSLVPVYSTWEVASSAVIHSAVTTDKDGKVLKTRGQYQQFAGVPFFTSAAAANNIEARRLSWDAGQLAFVGMQSLKLGGTVTAKPLTTTTTADGITTTEAKSRGGWVDIATNANIEIVSDTVSISKKTGVLYLDAGELTAVGSESLLVGGLRKEDSQGAYIDVMSSQVRLANGATSVPADTLSGADVILVARDKVTAAANSALEQKGTLLGDLDTYRMTSTRTLAGGEKIAVYRGGGSLVFANGMTAGTLKPDVAYTVTLADGTSTDFAANTTIASLAAGSSVTLKSAGSLVFNAQSTGGVVAVSSSDGALLRATDSLTASVIRDQLAYNDGVSTVVEKGAKISGRNVKIDSSGSLNVAEGAALQSLAGSNNSILGLSGGQVALLADSTATSSTSNKLGIFGLPKADTSDWLVITQADFQKFTSGSGVAFSGLDLTSYTSLYVGAEKDTTFGADTLGSLALHSGEIRGFGPGAVTIKAKTLGVDNASNAQGLAYAGSATPGESALTFSSDVMRLGRGAVSILGYDRVTVVGRNGTLLGKAEATAATNQGSLSVTGDLTLSTALVSAESGARYDVSSTGDLSLERSDSPAGVTGGFGAEASFRGAALSVDTDIRLASGKARMASTAGDLIVNARVDVSCQTQKINDATVYSDGGDIALSANGGNLLVDKDAVLDVSATKATGGATTNGHIGNAGKLSLTALGTDDDTGFIDLKGTMSGYGGLSNATASSGTFGRFSADAYDFGDFGNLNATLTEGGFLQSRTFRLRDGDLTVDGSVRAHAIEISADNGSLFVKGSLDASGTLGGVINTGLNGYDSFGNHGGSISLFAGKSVVLEKTASLDASAASYNSAGKGGEILLAAGAPLNGVTPSSTEERDSEGLFDPKAVAAVDIHQGSKINLEIADFTRVSVAKDKELSMYTGELFRATSDGVLTYLPEPLPPVTDPDAPVVVPEEEDPVVFKAGDVVHVRKNAVVALKASGEIQKLIDPDRGVASGALHLRAPRTSPVLGDPDVQVNPIAGSVLGASSIVIEGTKSYAIDVTKKETVDSLKTKAQTDASAFASADGVDDLRELLAGKNLTSLDAVHLRPGVDIFATGSELTLNTTWNFSGLRYGSSVDEDIAGSGEPGYLRMRTPANLVLKHTASLTDGFLAKPNLEGGLWRGQLLAPNTESWSFQLVAGADLSAANPATILPLNKVAGNAGSLLLGDGANNLSTLNATTLRRSGVIPGNYQVIRTGTGNIDLQAARDVRFIGPLFAVYTAGTSVEDPTRITEAGDFDVPSLFYVLSGITDQLFGNNSGKIPYTPQFTQRGGSIRIAAGNDVRRQKPRSDAVDSAKQMPTNWLYRRSNIAEDGTFRSIQTKTAVGDTDPEVASTSWWTSFDNFFQDIGTFGGGNVTVQAGRDVQNVSASVATNARMTKSVENADGSSSLLARDQRLSELGGGDLHITAGRNIDGGAYYVERGIGQLIAAGDVTTNVSRTTVSETQLTGNASPDAVTWLPTTFFLGKGSFDVTAGGSAKVGSVTNPFLLPQDINNTPYHVTFFSTAAESNRFTVKALQGDVSMVGQTGRHGDLFAWYSNVLYSPVGRTSAAGSTQPWLMLLSSGGQRFASNFSDVTGLYPSTVTATALSGSINLSPSITLLPSKRGNLDLLARKSVIGFQPLATTDPLKKYNPATNPYSAYGYARVIVSDSDFGTIASPTAPESWTYSTNESGTFSYNRGILSDFRRRFDENQQVNGPLTSQQALHGRNPDGVAGDMSLALHADDSIPMRVYSERGDIAGISLFSPKVTKVVAGRDITDVQLTFQNARPGDATVLFAGRDVIFFNPNSQFRRAASEESIKNLVPLSGNVQIGGPGSLQIIAGRNLDLGPAQGSLGSSSGIASVGNGRNPYLPFEGASLVLGAGLTPPGASSLTSIDFTSLVNRYLNPATAPELSKRYLPVLAASLGTKPENAWAQLKAMIDAGELTSDYLFSKANLSALNTFFNVLRDAGRDYNNPKSPSFGTYTEGEKAVATLFPGSGSTDTAGWTGRGSVSLASRSVRTTNGGDITVLTPGGGLSLGQTLNANAVGSPPGIITEYGGGISILARDNVDVGISRIFTLRGGDEIIWSSLGSIAAGISSKTVQAAPPTRVLIDPQSANVKTDLAGLATGGGIGVLASVPGVKPGDVDLIAPKGTVDAGDAGIRSSGNLNIAALQVLNAANIQVGGSTSGTPPAPPAPNLSIAAASNAAAVPAAETKTASEQAAADKPIEVAKVPSLVQVEVLGYGGGDDEEEKEDEESSSDGTVSADTPSPEPTPTP